MTLRSFSLAIHGGAGVIRKELYSGSELKAYRNALKEVVEIGGRILNKGGSAQEAVVACVMKLEDLPMFNAGKGSVFASDGSIEMDACLMCGKTLNAGGVTKVTVIKNPILAAKLVMEKTNHRLIAGKSIEELAREYGLQTEPKEYFITQKRYEQFVKAKQVGKMSLDHGSDSNTVGAVALDTNSNLAAATSTGGMTLKMGGRVSDTSILGAGNYANNETLAISATGTGDEFIRHVSCYDVHAQIIYGNISLEDALRSALDKVKSTGGEGGFIAINKEGDIFMPFNSGGMFRGSMTSEGTVSVGIFADD